MNDAGFQSTFQQYGAMMAAKMDILKMSAGQIIKDESSRFAATLIKLSGPKVVNEAKQRIADKVQGKFAMLAQDNPKSHTSDGGVLWYAFQPDAIFGVAEDKDMRGSSVDELYKYYFATRLNKQGRVVAGKRGRQTVYIWQKALTKAATVQQLSKRLQDHIGRRQAGWLKAWRASGALMVGNPIAQSVLRHEVGARGGEIDATNMPGRPEFTLINTAVGASKLQDVLSAAAKLRTGAISKDMVLYIRGIKKVKK